MSILFATVVDIGAVFANHLILGDPENVILLDPAPVFANKVNDFPATTVGIVIVQFALTVIVCIVPLAIDNVLLELELPYATTPSVYAVNVIELLVTRLFAVIAPVTYRVSIDALIVFDRDHALFAELYV